MPVRAISPDAGELPAAVRETLPPVRGLPDAARWLESTLDVGVPVRAVSPDAGQLPAAVRETPPSVRGLPAAARWLESTLDVGVPVRAISPDAGELPAAVRETPPSVRGLPAAARWLESTAGAAGGEGCGAAGAGLLCALRAARCTAGPAAEGPGRSVGFAAAREAVLAESAERVAAADEAPGCG
ncbi:hypothetical protein [Streptomyces sp. NPDC055189]